jgi:hypothetical protein
MSFLFVFTIGAILSICELAVLHAVTPKKFELKLIDNIFTAIISNNYFFLPFTIKIKKYKGIQEANIRSRKVKDKYSTYTVYDLVLKFSNKSIVLFNGKRNKKDMLKYCEQINQSILSFEECTINEFKIGKEKNIILLILLFAPLIFFIAPIISNTNYAKDLDYLLYLYIYITATSLTTMFVLLSFIVNRRINLENNEKNIDKKNIDIDSESKRIYDSLIK